MKLKSTRLRRTAVALTTAVVLGGSSLFSSLAVAQSELPLNIACNEECQAALALEADPESIDCTVAVSWSTTSFAYGAGSIQGSQDYQQQYFPNMELLVAEGRNDASTQSGQIDDFVARGIDVLVVSPVDAAAIGPAVERAITAGVKVIASDRNVDAEGVSTYIGADNVDTGITAGEFAIELLGDEGGKVIEIAGTLGASPTIDRAAGFREALAGSNLEIIESQTANYDLATALSVMEDLLQRYAAGEISLVFAHGSQMAIGALQAIKEAGRDEILVVGIDDDKPAMESIVAGDLPGVAAYPLTFREHMNAAAKLCAGESVPPRIKLDSALVTQENAEDFLPGW